MLALIVFQKKTLKLDVCFHYHNPETGKIVVYNLSKRSFSQVHVEVFNSLNQRFIYRISEILPRVGVLIDYSEYNDIEGNRFFGEITKIIVNVGKLSKEFIPGENNRFKVV